MSLRARARAAGAANPAVEEAAIPATVVEQAAAPVQAAVVDDAPWEDVDEVIVTASEEAAAIDAGSTAIVEAEEHAVVTASPSRGSMVEAQKELADAGFATDTSFGTFPSFVLANIGKFQCKDWSPVPFEKLVALDVVVIQVRRKWLYREKALKDAALCYSYDELPFPKNANAADANGGLVSAFIDKLESEGKEWESKLYYEALALIVGGEGEGWQDHVEEMILISMSPTTKTKWSGFVLQNKFVRKLLPHEYVTRISCGPMMQAKGNNYYPMAFKIRGKVDLSTFSGADEFEIVSDVA